MRIYSISHCVKLVLFCVIYYNVFSIALSELIVSMHQCAKCSQSVTYLGLICDLENADKGVKEITNSLLSILLH